METIFALASAPGRAGVAVLRLSGPLSGPAIEALTGRALPVPRMATLARLRDLSGADIDEALVLWFKGPSSFTGEDVAEFQVHGGRAIVESLMVAFAGLRVRPAEAGEFTRRAVENGRLDLTRAEAIADLVDAQTEAQRRQALHQYDGALARLYEGWREVLVRAAAWMEAALDFSDEELPAETLQRSRTQLADILGQMRAHLADGGRGEIIRDGIRLTVIGPPNAGKSSLINLLARRDVAIVSETAGTTRDIIEVRLDLDGYPVILADTAGLRESLESVEVEGVRRALARAKESHLTLLLLDGSLNDPMAGLPDDLRPDLTVWNKIDKAWPAERDGFAISLKTEVGVDALVAALSALVKQTLDGPGDSPVLTRSRHRFALERAAAALGSAVKAPLEQSELIAEDLRMALRELGRITGKVDVEELLDAVFRDFCIGK